MKQKIFILDDHPFMRRGYAHLINREPDLRVCGEAESVEEAMAKIQRAVPDLALIDITLEGVNGIDLIRRLRTRWPSLSVLVVSRHEETLYAERALRAGARGYLMKNEVDAVVIEAIRRVLEGGFYVSEEMNTKILLQYMGHAVDEVDSAMERLTERELEVFELMGQGLTTRQVAQAMHISPKTVETHRGHIKAKLEVDTNARLLQRAVQWVEGERIA